MRQVGDYENVVAGRRKLEVRAARKIAEYLWNTQLSTIRRLVHQMIRKLLSVNPVILDGTRGIGVTGLLTGQKAFMMWSECGVQPSVAGLKAVQNYLWRQDGGEKWLFVCSDVIRLFGEVAEHLAGMGEDWKNFVKAKDKLRPEPIYAKPKRNKFGYYEDTDRGWGHRDRADKEDPARMGWPFVDIPRERVPWRGVEKFKFGERSVIDVIDWMYGLPVEGAGVSGTTTDSIAALRWFGPGGQVNPLAQLIAIATMVPQGHHTIVECAWPLTRFNYMNYHIGFYDTLLPEDADSDYGSLRTALSALENDPGNRHVLGYLRGGQPIWMEFESREEIEAYKSVSGIRTAYGFCVGGPPRDTTIEGFLQGKHVKQEIINALLNR